MNVSKAANGTGAYTGGIPLNVTLHAWPVPKLQPEHKQFSQTNVINFKNSESAKNFTNRIHNLNATGYVAIDEDLTDTGFTDVQTLILAGIATLIPLFIGVAIILGIRYLWRRYRQRKGEGYEGVLQREESSDPLGKIQGRNLPLELKNSESQFSINPGGELTNTSSPNVLTPKSNGSVITMTLKNNHLIVETEETNDPLDGIKIESKGTTTKFVTPTAPDLRINMSMDETDKLQEKNLRIINGMSSSLADHDALIHGPPKEAEEEADRESCNTGLSQSDLSVSSTESQNPSYRYGNQTGYDSGGYGYPEYSGYAAINGGKSMSNAQGPRETRACNRNSSAVEQPDSIAIDSGSDQQPDPLELDTSARASLLEKVEEDDRYQEEQRALGNGDLPPDGMNDAANGSDRKGKGERPAVNGTAANHEDPHSRSCPPPSSGPKGSRFEQLKREISAAEEFECYPRKMVNDSVDSSFNS